MLAHVRVTLSGRRDASSTATKPSSCSPRSSSSSSPERSDTRSTRSWLFEHVGCRIPIISWHARAGAGGRCCTAIAVGEEVDGDGWTGFIDSASASSSASHAIDSVDEHDAGDAESHERHGIVLYAKLLAATEGSERVGSRSCGSDDDPGRGAPASPRSRRCSAVAATPLRGATGRRRRSSRSARWHATFELTRVRELERAGAGLGGLERQLLRAGGADGAARPRSPACSTGTSRCRSCPRPTCSRSTGWPSSAITNSWPFVTRDRRRPRGTPGPKTTSRRSPSRSTRPRRSTTASVPVASARMARCAAGARWPDPCVGGHGGVAGSVRLQHAVVGEVGEQAACVCPSARGCCHGRARRAA